MKNNVSTIEAGTHYETFYIVSNKCGFLHLKPQQKHSTSTEAKPNPRMGPAGALLGRKSSKLPLFECATGCGVEQHNEGYHIKLKRNNNTVA